MGVEGGVLEGGLRASPLLAQPVLPSAPVLELPEPHKHSPPPHTHNPPPPKVALRTPGFSGADLANLLNESAILAGRRGLTAVRNQEIDDAVDRIVAGMEGKPLTDGKAKQLVAYHEVGHAICGTLTPGHDPVQKVGLCFLVGCMAPWLEVHGFGFGSSGGGSSADSSWLSLSASPARITLAPSRLPR